MTTRIPKKHDQIYQIKPKKNNRTYEGPDGDELIPDDHEWRPHKQIIIIN